MVIIRRKKKPRTISRSQLMAERHGRSLKVFQVFAQRWLMCPAQRRSLRLVRLVATTQLMTGKRGYRSTVRALIRSVLLGDKSSDGPLARAGGQWTSGNGTRSLRAAERVLRVQGSKLYEVRSANPNAVLNSSTKNSTHRSDDRWDSRPRAPSADSDLFRDGPQRVSTKRAMRSLGGPMPGRGAHSIPSG